MKFHIDLDFCGLDSDPRDYQALEAEAQDWVDTYAKAPGVKATVVDHPRNGWPMIRLTSESPESLLGAIIAYDNGNEEIGEYVKYIVRSAA